MQKTTHNAFLCAAMTAAMFSIPAVRIVGAQQKTPDAPMKMSEDAMKMSPEQMKMAGEHMDKMKMMAADPAQAQHMTADLAQMMVMDHMAMQMAMDPKFKEMSAQSMSDGGMKKVHDDAKMMADDPAQRAKMQQQVMSDPKLMQIVMHMAAQMASMHGPAMKEMHDAGMKDMHEPQSKQAPDAKK